jgi:hypothetical protein
MHNITRLRLAYPLRCVCVVEVTESSTNKQHTLSPLSALCSVLDRTCAVRGPHLQPH